MKNIIIGFFSGIAVFSLAVFFLIPPALEDTRRTYFYGGFISACASIQESKHENGIAIGYIGCEDLLNQAVANDYFSQYESIGQTP